MVGGSDHPYNGRVVWNIETYTNGVWRLYDRIHPTGPFTKGSFFLDSLTLNLNLVNRLNYRCTNEQIIVWAIDIVGTGKSVSRYNFKSKQWDDQLQCNALNLFDLVLGE